MSYGKHNPPHNQDERIFIKISNGFEESLSAVAIHSLSFVSVVHGRPLA